jgi:quercetin dioxygenase-like cupin family protein
MGIWSSARYEEEAMAVETKVKLLTDRDVPYSELVPGLELARAITSAGTTQLGGGYMRFAEDAEFADWTVTYDEVLFVQAGELTVVSGGAHTVARAGEAILIPKGAKVTYRGRAGTVSFFVLWPFDWNKKVDRLTKGADTGRA